MKPAEALYYLENYGGQAAVPALYTDMPREQLEALAKECERPSADARRSRTWSMGADHVGHGRSSVAARRSANPKRDRTLGL